MWHSLITRGYLVEGEAYLDFVEANQNKLDADEKHLFELVKTKIEAITSSKSGHKGDSL